MALLLAGLPRLALGFSLIAQRRKTAAGLGRWVGDAYSHESQLNAARTADVRNGLKDPAGQVLLRGFVTFRGAVLIAAASSSAEYSSATSERDHGPVLRTEAVAQRVAPEEEL